MDSELLSNCPNKVVEKLNKTTKRIQKARKNTKLAEKEAAEFQEIHKLLQSADTSDTSITDSEIETNESKPSESSTIPVDIPGLKVFHEELIYSLFSESNCCLKSFIPSKEKCLIFGKNESIPTEECLRKLIAYHVTENLMTEEGSCSSISLYVLYLMSVHHDFDFVASCFDFLIFQKFFIQPEDIFPIFVNFGGKDLFEVCEESLLKKFSGGNGEISQKSELPSFNMEMVGRVLLQYITNDLLVINSNIKPLIKGLVKILLDPVIRSGSLLPLFSTILTVLCVKAQKDYKLEEILGWVHLKEEHLLNQIEICRIISKVIFPDLHESLVLKIQSEILKTEILPSQPPIRISHIKSVLRKLQRREVSALELYSLLQLINSSLPGLTATVKDSTEINTHLASLEQKISKVVDSVDLIRLKLEIAKVGNLVANNVKNRFTVHGETAGKSTVKRIKCSNQF